jgi:putative pyruvate formate lyase activating enzyme
MVRHLVMPGPLDDTRAILEFLAGLSGDLYVNAWIRTTRPGRCRLSSATRAINRPVTGAEFAEALAAARAARLWRLDTRWCHR